MTAAEERALSGISIRASEMKKNEQLIALAKALAKIDFCMMQTVGERGISTRPMSKNSEAEYDGEHWFFTHSGSTKIGEIAKDARVQLLFADNALLNFISVWGAGEVVSDPELKMKMQNDSPGRWLQSSPDDPAVSLIKVSADRIQTWGRLGDCVLE